MNWKKLSVERLSDYENRKRAISSLSERLEALEIRYISIKAARTDGTPVKGGGNSREDSLINSIVEREELKRNLQITKHEVRITKRGLDALSGEEIMVLEKFYINRTCRHVDELCELLNYEKTRIYEIKEAALRKFTLSCYGVIEI